MATSDTSFIANNKQSVKQMIVSGASGDHGNQIYEDCTAAI